MSAEVVEQDKQPLGCAKSLMASPEVSNYGSKIAYVAPNSPVADDEDML